MSGIGLQGAFGAAGGQDALEQLIAERAKAAILKQQEEQRQFQNQRALAAEGLNERKFGEDTRQFDASLGQQGRQFDASHGLALDQFGFQKQQWGDEAPQRAANLDFTTAQTGEVRRRPQAEADARAHEIAQTNLGGAWNLRAIGASGDQARRTASFASSLDGRAGGPSLGVGQQADMADMATLDQVAQDVLTTGEESGWDGVGGMLGGSRDQFLARNFGMGTPTAQQLRSNIANITATIAKLRGGTAFTPNEQKLLEQYTPTINDDPLVIKAKIANLRKFIQDKRANTLSVAAGQFGQLGGGNGLVREVLPDANNPLGLNLPGGGR